MADSVDAPVPFSNDSTSREAAEAMRSSGRASTQAARILEVLRMRGEIGGTFYEIQESLEADPAGPPVGIRQVTARTNGLVRAGYVRDSGVKRRAFTGMQNIVWVAVAGDPAPVDPKPQVVGRIAAVSAAARERYRTLETAHLRLLAAFGRGEFTDSHGVEGALAAERAALLRIMETGLAERWGRDRLREAIGRRMGPELALAPAPGVGLVALLEPQVAALRAAVDRDRGAKRRLVPAPAVALLEAIEALGGLRPDPAVAGGPVSAQSAAGALAGTSGCGEDLAKQPPRQRPGPDSPAVAEAGADLDRCQRAFDKWIGENSPWTVGALVDAHDAAWSRLLALLPLLRAVQNYRNCWTPDGTMSVNMAARIVCDSLRSAETALAAIAGGATTMVWLASGEDAFNEVIDHLGIYSSPGAARAAALRTERDVAVIRGFGIDVVQRGAPWEIVVGRRRDPLTSERGAMLEVALDPKDLLPPGAKIPAPEAGA
jgi:hypothetical protein